MRLLAEDENVTGGPAVYEGENNIYRMRREDFLKYGYTEGCPWY